MKLTQLLSCTLNAGRLPFFNIANSPLSALLATSIAITIVAPASAQTIPGGFIEMPGAAVRSTLSRNQVAQILPERGRFNFPAPYNTAGIRLTNSEDCGGSDCVNYVGYSYWRNINNHAGEDSMLIFVGLERTEGGPGPSLFQYNKLTDRVENLGPLFESSHPLSWSSGEGWYFSATNPTALYVNDQQKLQRYDVIDDTLTTVFSASLFGNNRYLWQFHSSSNDRVHSATLRSSGDYSMLGCAVYFETTGETRFFPRKGDYDECQVDKSGKWLLIKENVDGQDGEDNRIINLETGQERVLLDRDGAGGHSDLGYGYMIASDNWASDANTHKLWDFNAQVLKGKVVYRNNNWNVSAPDHITHSNARPDLAPEQQYACGSSLNATNGAHANEIICFGLNGNPQTLVVAPVLSNPDGGDAYSISPKGNLDPTGRYFIWTSNLGGSRMDLFLVKVPGHLLDGGAASFQPEPDRPAVPAAPPGLLPVGLPEAAAENPRAGNPTSLEPSALDWNVLSNITAGSDGSLVKSGGCDGCEDALAVSQKALERGNMALDLTVSDTWPLYYLGASQSQDGTGYSDIDHALRVQDGRAEVRENGEYMAETVIDAGDRLRISVVDGTVHYYRNGTEFYQSTLAPQYPLRAYATLFNTGSMTGPVRVSLP